MTDQEWLGTIADCDNHRSDYADFEIMDDLHSVSSGEGAAVIVTAEGIFCSQGCADEAYQEWLVEISFDLEGE